MSKMLKFLSEGFVKKFFIRYCLPVLWVYILIDCIQSTFSILDYFSKPEMLITPLLKFSGFAPLIMRISFFQLKNLTAFNIAVCIAFGFLLFKLLMAIFIFLKKKKKFVGLGVLFAYTLDFIALIYFYSTTQFISEIFYTSILLLAFSILYNLIFIILALIFIRQSKNSLEAVSEQTNKQSIGGLK